MEKEHHINWVKVSITAAIIIFILAILFYLFYYFLYIEPNSIFGSSIQNPTSGNS